MAVTFWITTILIPYMQLQAEPRLWKAVVIDGSSGNPISEVHVLTSKRQSISDANGYFELETEDGTQVSFSHVAYEKIEISVDHEQLPDTVFLIPLEFQLDEVEINSFPAEGDFKKEVLNNPYILNVMERNLQNNLNYAKSIYKLGYFHDMSSYNVLLVESDPMVEPPFLPREAAESCKRSRTSRNLPFPISQAIVVLHLIPEQSKNLTSLIH